MTPHNDLWRDVTLALSLLTRLPIKVAEDTYSHSAKAAWAYPIVGIVTGVLSCLAASFAFALGIPLWATAIIALGTGILATGAMHEDGLADCADGFWGGWDPAMRLKIMKDSQIGTYGVIALALGLALRLGAIVEILRWDNWALALVAVHIAARAVMPSVMHVLKHARDTGLSRSVGPVPRKTAITSAAIGMSALILGFGLFGVALAFLAALSVSAVIQLARVKIGGQTGDVCGASQQIAEITLLLAIISG